MNSVNNPFSTKPFFKATLRSNKFDTELTNYMNAIPKNFGIPYCIDKDTNLFTKICIMIRKELDKVRTLNKKFLFSIIIDRSNKEYIIRLDIFDKALSALLKRRQDILSSDQDPNDRFKEHSHDIIEQNSVDCPALVIMIFDQIMVEDNTIPKILRLDSGFYDTSDLQFLSITNSRTYKALITSH